MRAFLATVLLATLAVVARPSEIAWHSLSGVALDEGNSLPRPKQRDCSVDCCKAQCESVSKCNSIAVSSDVRGKGQSFCYLHDKCFDVDASTPTKNSSFTTYFMRPCRNVSAASWETAQKTATNSKNGPQLLSWLKKAVGGSGRGRCGTCSGTKFSHCTDAESVEGDVINIVSFRSERNSGSNWLRSRVNDNTKGLWFSKLQPLKGCIAVDADGLLGWKHAHLDPAVDTYVPKNLLLIVVFRDVFRWLVSMYYHSYTKDMDPVSRCALMCTCVGWRRRLSCTIPSQMHCSRGFALILLLPPASSPSYVFMRVPLQRASCDCRCVADMFSRNT